MRAVVVYNPVAGSAVRRQAQFEHAIGVFEQARWDVSVVGTNSGGHAADLSREAVSWGANVVIAAGGDGTVNEVLQGLVGSDAALGVLPMGTVNVWAREAGFSSRVVTAAQQLVAGSKVTLDVGKVGNRFFLLMAGIGLDAEVTAALGGSQIHKQKVGVLPYIIRLGSIVPRYQGSSIDIEVDGKLHQQQALMILVSNTRLYGGLRRPIRHAVANDGLLDVRIFPGRGLVDTLRHLINFLTERQELMDSGNVLRTKRLLIRAEPQAAVQVDGDPIGTTPVEILVVPQALKVFLSPSYDRSLLGMG